MLTIGLLDKSFAFCNTCSENLLNQLQTSRKWIIGNREYSPLVELQSRMQETDDEAWVELERRPATDEEKIRLKDEYYD